jgi:tRNA1Val (adenine37-N6)-methyltransferase
MKTSSDFHFKQFIIEQDRCTHKVGTDGVLLGAWANINGAKTILDIGTGTGMIALMLAQRTSSDVQIDAIEIEKEDAEQASSNIDRSPWKDRIKVHQLPVQSFLPDKQYDLIVSNPPYFINSQLPPTERRTQARHTLSLSYHELLYGVKKLMQAHGTFAVILPFIEGSQFIDLAKDFKLNCIRKMSFKTREQKPIERLLLEFSYRVTPCENSEMLLYQNGLQWSEDYQNLTRSFYLKL